MEESIIEKTNQKNLRKESISSNISESTSSSIDETNKQKRKFSDEFDLFLSENEEVDTSEKTFMQKFMGYFSKKENEERKKLLVEDEKRTIQEIITSKGFKCEEHIVKTEDGYNLTIFRIPGNKNCEDGSKLQPVLLQHSVFDSSDGWVCNGEEHSLPFIFAKNNFDVYISNSRGNKYCKEHEKYDNKSFEFWQFSFHEMGLYDIPAVIDHINSTNKSGEKIIYFGHSQGTSLMFSGLTQKYEYYKKNIKLFVALAPVANLAHLGSTLLSILSKLSVHKLVNKIKIYEMGANTGFMNFMEKYASSLTNFFINLISDSNSKTNNDQNALAVYVKHSPCGCSLKCLIHFVHIIKAKKFIYYNYKKEANFALYHQIEPPEYDLSVIKDIPIMLIGGEMDKLGTPDDVRWLNDQLAKNGNVIYFKIHPKMGHLSFMCAKDFSWFHEPLKIILEQYSPPNSPEQ